MNVSKINKKIIEKINTRGRRPSSLVLDVGGHSFVVNVICSVPVIISRAKKSKEKNIPGAQDMSESCLEPPVVVTNPRSS
jgi:hypothetical protein